MYIPNVYQIDQRCIFWMAKKCIFEMAEKYTLQMFIKYITDIKSHFRGLIASESV